MVCLAECEPEANHSQYKEEQDGADDLVALPSDLPEPPLAAFIEADDSRHLGLPSTHNRDSNACRPDCTRKCQVVLPLEMETDFSSEGAWSYVMSSAESGQEVVEGRLVREIDRRHAEAPSALVAAK